MPTWASQDACCLPASCDCCLLLLLQNSDHVCADTASLASRKSDRRKLRLKHQRIMLTLDRQLAAMLTGSSGPQSPAAAGNLGTEPQPSVPGLGAAARAADEEQATKRASTSGESLDANNGSRRGARTPLGRLEANAAAEETKRQCSAVRRRPTSAPAVLQRGSDPAAAANPMEPAAALAHCLPAPGELHESQNAGKPTVIPDGDTQAASGNHHRNSQILGGFGGPAWGATEARCPALNALSNVMIS